jgi:hypothetical protein
MECPKGIAKYDSLIEECIDCEFKEKCKEDAKKNTKEKKVSKAEMKREEILVIAQGIRDNFTASPEELIGYRSCVKVIKRVEEEYKKQNIRRKKNHKERMREIKQDIKDVAKMKTGDREDLLLIKLNLLIDYADYIVLGDI